MRQSFENNLKKYGESAKKMFGNFNAEGKKVYESEKEVLTTEAAKNSFTNSEAEQEIFEIQKQKQQKIKTFKTLLNKTRGENGDLVHPKLKGEHPLVIKNSDGSFQVKDNNGRTTQVTLGEIMTDYEWGAQYEFDPSVNIHTVREYYFDQLKNSLKDKLDDQLIISETAFTRGETAKQEAYEKIKERKGLELEQQGVIAEKMVKNFLKKIAIDGHADFEIIDADVFQDVENKADFIIRRKNFDRVKAAKVVESELVDHPTFETVGVQFTINSDAEKQKTKEKQIKTSKKHLEGMQDLVLVTLPTHDAGKLYKEWEKKKTPGGPEKGWSLETKEAIFRGVMTKVLTPEEIELFCENNFKNNS